MGVTDVYSITVDGVKNFKARIDSEEQARRSWNGKWGWMLHEYKKINELLNSLIGQRAREDTVEKSVDSRTTLPIPDTVNHEYGWLASQPDFVLEKYRTPGLARIPKYFPQEITYRILDEHLCKKEYEDARKVSDI